MALTEHEELELLELEELEAGNQSSQSDTVSRPDNLSGNVLKDVTKNAPHILWKSAGELEPMAREGLGRIARSIPDSVSPRSVLSGVGRFMGPMGTPIEAASRFLPNGREMTGNVPLDVLRGTPRVIGDTLAETAPDFVSRASMIGAGIGAAAKPVAKMAAPILRPVGRYAGRVASEVAGKMTGVSPSDIQGLYKQPSAILQMTSGKAGKLYETAQKGAAEIPVDEAYESARKTAMRIVDRANKGYADPIEAWRGRQNLDDIISRTSDSIKLRQLEADRNLLNSVVKLNPELAQADAIYSKYKLGSTFRKLLPVTKRGEISLTKSTVGPALATMAGHPELAALASPLTTGAATSMLGGAAKLAKTVAPYVQSPGLMGTVGAGSSMSLNQQKAKEFVSEAQKQLPNGSPEDIKAKARQMAREAGFSF